MNNKLALGAACIIMILGQAGCSGPGDARFDPCTLLTVDEAKGVDASISYSLWAGRGGPKKDDEVCVFYSEQGEPQVMLFAWYDKDKDPAVLIESGNTDPYLELVTVPGLGSKAAAGFKDGELKLLAVKSGRGIVGVRVRKPVTRDSEDFDAVGRLAEAALLRR